MCKEPLSFNTLPARKNEANEVWKILPNMFSNEILTEKLLIKELFSMYKQVRPKGKD